MQLSVSLFVKVDFWIIIVSFVLMQHDRIIIFVENIEILNQINMFSHRKKVITYNSLDSRYALQPRVFVEK